MEYILTWSNGIGRVSAGEFLYDLTEKPNVGFEFDALYFETPGDMYMKVIGTAQAELTEQERKLCQKFCDDYYESDEFKVFGIDPELKILKGFMTRGECKAQGLEEVIDTAFPEFPLVKRVGDKWERVVAVISEKGKLVLLPDGDHPAFNFFFTEEEWNAFPKPSYIDETFDFKTNTWIDTRNLEQTKSNARLYLKNILTSKYQEFNLAGGIEDLVLYLIQAMEASVYNLNNDSTTPFVDSVVANMTDETKDGFMQRINKHYAPEYLATLGAIHGKMMQKLDELSACNTLEEVDALVSAYDDTDTNRIWRRPVNVDPYATAD